jgi:hypothetical protein
MFRRSKRHPAQPVSHQTVRLSKGKHTSAEQGACVMELASMLAGEPFTDHPVSVCPVIGSFLRMYNDSIDNKRRQDLYAYASKVVGSRASEMVRWARADRLANWAFEMRQTRRSGIVRRFHARAGARPGTISALGIHAVCSIKKHTDESHAAVLELIDELLEMRPPKAPAELPTPAEQPIVAGG